jgi:hypothetical protein
LVKLEAKMKEKQATVDVWFDRPNLLRFLQANKFKTSNTIDSMLETTKWRANEFPLKMDASIEKMLVPLKTCRILVPFTSADGTTSIARSWWQTSGSSTQTTCRRSPRCWQ